MENSSSMRFFTSVAVCCFCVTGAAYFYWDSSQSQFLPLTVEPSVIDFGDVHGGNTVQGASLIKNISNKPLRILRTITSCSCNDVKLRQGVLLPEEVAELTVAWDIPNRTGMVSTPLVIVYVWENDNQQLLQVGLKANIISVQRCACPTDVRRPENGAPDAETGGKMNDGSDEKSTKKGETEK